MSRSEEAIELAYTDAEDIEEPVPTEPLFESGENRTKVPRKPSTKSQTYEIVRELDDEEEEELGYSDQEKTDTIIPKTIPRSKTEKLKHKLLSDAQGFALLITYTISGVAIFSFMIAAFIRNDPVLTDKMMILILVCTLITTMLSAVALVKYGRLQDQIHRMKQQNRIYDRENIKLHKTNRYLKGEIDDLDNENDKLNAVLDDIKDQSSEFSDLVTDLKEVAKDGEELMDVLNRFNGTFDRMNDWIYQTERSRLLAAYYECAFRDAENEMNRKEYERFLTIISKQFRLKFQKLGFFDDFCEEEKETIDLSRFLEIVELVLREADDVIQREFIKTLTIVPGYS